MQNPRVCVAFASRHGETRVDSGWHRSSASAPFNQSFVDPNEIYTIWSFQTQRYPWKGKGHHRDKENRIMSLVIYFSDAERSGWKGGDFEFFDGSSPNRHAQGQLLFRQRPQNNLGVGFLVKQRSIHQVSAFRTAGESTRNKMAMRRVVYISIARRTTSWRHIHLNHRRQSSL